MKKKTKDYLKYKVATNTESTFHSICTRYIPNAISEVVKLAPKLKGKTDFETCKKIDRFIRDNVTYKNDEPGYEEIRLPNRLLADKVGDCEDFTILGSAILQNLAVAHTIRMADYGKGWQHIYIKVGNITLDPVQEGFNQEDTGKYLDFHIDPKGHGLGLLHPSELEELSPDNKELMKVLSYFMWKKDDFYPKCALFNSQGVVVSDRTKLIFIEGETPNKGTFDINSNRILPENVFGNLNDVDLGILSKVDFKIEATLRSVKKRIHGMIPSDKKTFITLLPMPSKLLATNKTVEFDSPDDLQISDFIDLNLVDYKYTGKAFPMRFSMREFNDILKIVGNTYDDSIRGVESQLIELKFCFIGAYSRQQRALVITFPSIFGKTNILLMPIIIRSDEYSQMYGTTYIEQYEKMFKEYVANALMSFKSKLKKL